MNHNKHTDQRSFVPTRQPSQRALHAPTHFTCLWSNQYGHQSIDSTRAPCSVQSSMNAIGRMSIVNPNSRARPRPGYPQTRSLGHNVSAEGADLTCLSPHSALLHMRDDKSFNPPAGMCRHFDHWQGVCMMLTSSARLLVEDPV